jgi:Leucine-rich repeat (LRR) protein
MYTLSCVPMQILDLAGCSMSGSLPADLSNLANLRQLDLSNNPRVRGTLPTLFAGLSFLQSLDVSGCSISGMLPAEYAALQQLQVFRAANTSITGQLPDSWGLLQNLKVRRHLAAQRLQQVMRMHMD